MASTGFIVDMDNFGNGGRQLRLRCSHTRLFCTLFWRPWFRASRQAKNLEADRVQSVSTVSKPPTGTAEERHNGTYGRLITASETEHNAGYGRSFFVRSGCSDGLRTAMGQGAEVWNSVPLRDRATVQGGLGNGRPFCLEVRRPMRTRILDGDKLQVAAFQQVNLIDGFEVVVAASFALGFRHKDLRPLEPGLHNALWAVLDQVSVRRSVPGPILRELEIDR